MRPADRNDPKVARVVEAAAAAGVTIEPVSFEAGTRTSADAAREIGCEVAEIAKSLVFTGDRAGDDETGPSVVLFLLSGADRVDLGAAGQAAGLGRLRRADPDTAKRVTGFAIGATPPFGHPERLQVVMDDRLLEMDHAWAAGGRTDTVFHISTADLARVTGATIARVREEA